MRDPDDAYVGSENVPLRGGKGGTWEGGVRVPMFAYWKGRIAPKVILARCKARGTRAQASNKLVS